MLARLRAAGLVWPTILSLVALGVLLSLGTWQWQRKAWKDALQTAINARASAPPVDMAAALAQWRGTAGAEYLRVRATGTFRHDLERAYYAPGPRNLAWHIYTPLLVEDGRVLWVNRGEVADADKSASAARGLAAPGVVTVVGLIRATGDKGQFTPDNEPARNIWFWRDLDGMHRSAFPSGTPATLPFFLEAVAERGGANSVTAPAQPKPGVTRLDLANRHLEYALTWWGLAATLVGVFGVFAWGRLRPAGSS